MFCLDQRLSSAPALTTLTRRSRREFEVLWASILELATFVRSILGGSTSLLSDASRTSKPVLQEGKLLREEMSVQALSIERECLRLLALYEPVATDLRRLSTALHVNAELERIGDLSLHIAKQMRKADDLDVPLPLCDLATLVEKQVGRSFALLAMPDDDAARLVINSDCEIDEFYHHIRWEIKGAIRETPELLDHWLRVLNTARNLERIGDHAVSIAEAVLYLIDGSFLRHDSHRLVIVPSS